MGKRSKYQSLTNVIIFNSILTVKQEKALTTNLKKFVGKRVYPFLRHQSSLVHQFLQLRVIEVGVIKLHVV